MHLRPTLLVLAFALCLVVAATARPHPFRARVPAPKPLPEAPPAQWFSQRLTHFNLQNNDMWNQRYFVRGSSSLAVLPFALHFACPLRFLDDRAVVVDARYFVTARPSVFTPSFPRFFFPLPGQ